MGVCWQVLQTQPWGQLSSLVLASPPKPTLRVLAAMEESDQTPSIPQWRNLHSVLSKKLTEPTVIQELQPDQIQYEVFVRRAVRWPDLQKAPQVILSVVGRALSCVVMPLYADWVQFRELLCKYLPKLNDYLPKRARHVDGEIRHLRSLVSRAMDRIDFLERRVAFLEARNTASPELAREALADDSGVDLNQRIQAAQVRAARVRGRSHSPAPTEIDISSDRSASVSR